MRCKAKTAMAMPSTPMTALHRPESSSLSYEDKSKGMKMQSVNGRAFWFRHIYPARALAMAGDAVMNGNPRYIYTFEACGASAARHNSWQLAREQGFGTFLDDSYPDLPVTCTRRARS